MACPIKWCTEKHGNMVEHFAAMRESKSEVKKRDFVSRLIPPETVSAPVITNVTNDITNDDPQITNATKKNRERVAKWQKTHREEYNAKMREYRRSNSRKVGK